MPEIGVDEHENTLCVHIRQEWILCGGIEATEISKCLQIAKVGKAEAERIGTMVDRLGLKEDEPLTAGLLTKQIENAQKRIEGRNFEARKHVLEYDNVMNRQREVIYGQRRRVLMGEDVKDSILRMADHVVDFAGGRWMNGEDPEEWEWREATNYLENLCCHHGALEEHRKPADGGDREGFLAALKEDARAFYAEREKMMEEIKRDLKQYAFMVRVVRVSRLEKGDVTDFFEKEGGTVEAFKAIVEKVK